MNFSNQKSKSIRNVKVIERSTAIVIYLILISMIPIKNEISSALLNVIPDLTPNCVLYSV